MLSAENRPHLAALDDRALADALRARGVTRLACAEQVHGAQLAGHGPGWQGWLRLRGVDGHVTTVPGTALAVTVADCAPVLIAHPRGAIAAVHAGWRGTADGILPRAFEALDALGFPATECLVHLGPAICGPCYEVGPEVFQAMGQTAPSSGRGCLDVRAVLAHQATVAGVRQVTGVPNASASACTCCQPDQYFSHRGGDTGRQLGVIALLPTPESSPRASRADPPVILT
jgi:YfiH family protein